MPITQTPAAITESRTAVPAYGVTNKRLTFIGDSTWPVVASTVSSLLTSYAVSGGPLDGCTIDKWGENGASLAAFMQDLVAFNFSALKALSPAPDIVCFGYGINSVRLGALTQAQFTAQLSSAIDQMVAAPSLAHTVFVMCTPNTFLTTEDGFHYIVPNSSAQAYAEILFNSYAVQAGRYPNVFVNDKQTRIFGRTCLPASVYMADQIHPNAAGQTAWTTDMLQNFLTQHIIDIAFP